IIGIGIGLQHHVIAEGVETSTQLEFLRENKCTTVQGFYLNRPMSGEKFTSFLVGRSANN
ncbi:EAL domain-containing protein, partial [Massilia glaciei]